jgi:RNA polymerase sigma factor (sigma-70 family)
MDVVVDSDAELLGRMVLQEADPVSARAAWEELYVRHREYLHAVVARAYGSFLGNDGTADLVVDAFRRAYEWAGRQSGAADARAKFYCDSDDGSRRRVRAWLGAIAERLFKDRFREQAVAATRHDEYVEDWRRQGAAEEHGDDALRQRARQALEALESKDAEVLRLSLPWYDPGARAFAIPSGEAAQLAAAVGLSVEAFRQRRHRALRKLATAMTQQVPVKTDGGSP